MQNSLQIESVMQAFGSRQILTDIYLECKTGDIVGLLGRNGTGKSILLKIIFGSLNGDSKFIRINGEILIQPFKVSDMIGYLPQHNFLPQHLSVYKIASLYLSLGEVTSFLDDPIIGSLQNNKIRTLSGGELRYLEIKLMLYSNHKFILLDEPFNGVAPIIVERLKSMIISQSKTKGIILTDHDYNNVMDVANRYCLLYDGGIKHIENKHDLVTWQYLKENSLE